MTALSSLLGGIFTAGGILALFRAFFIQFEFPVFYLAAVFLIFAAETALWFAYGKRLIPPPGKDGSFSFFPLIPPSVFYLPLFVGFVMLTRPVFGLDFTSTLPWYAVIVYPLVILIPLSGAAAFFFKVSLEGILKGPAFFSGFLLFLTADILFLNSLTPLSLALLASLAGFLFLFFYRRRRSPGYLYAFLSLIILFVFFSGATEGFHFFLRGVNREPETEYLESRITPYGEIAAHRRSGDSLRISVNHIAVLGHRNKQEVKEDVHLTMLQYPWAERVLLIGQDHRLLEEILRYPDLSSLYWVPVVPGLHDMVREHSAEPLPEKKALRILQAIEGRDFTDRFAGENFFDVVLISLPDPVNLFLNRYYTGDFFKTLQSAGHKHSLVSLTLESGDRRLRRNKQLLSGSVYKTLKNYFPNTLKVHGRRSLVLASGRRGFTTSPRAMSEYIQIIEDMPDYVSPSLLRYKLDSREKVLEQIDIPGAPHNFDLKPASLKYSFNEMVYTLGLWRGFLVRMTERVEPLGVYGVFLLLVGGAVFLLKKKNDGFKILTCLSAASFVFTFFIWNMAALLHSSTGRLYSYITIIILSASVGVFAGLKYQKSKDSAVSYSRISIFFVLSALFFILITVYFEFLLSPPAPAAAGVITFVGSFLLTSSIYSSLLSFWSNSKTRSILIYPLSASALAFGATVFILPVMGLVDVFPLNSILLLGLVFLLNTHQSV